ncbi:hypothetical protein H2204_009941 [Knufia peltigerae]|uniref:F-box domain-containing protein n=1 Tax=Knufia peltigerae TaxID=1002370 RepID=A0AA38XX89_9EURO|nr:hypothetical protein H2204_009941 [Knufia peltigerae]
MASREVFRIPESVRALDYPHKHLPLTQNIKILEKALVEVSAPQHHGLKRKRNDEINENPVKADSVTGKYKTVFGRRVAEAKTKTQTQTQNYPETIIETIDHDLLVQIFGYLDVPSRVSLALTNKFFGSFCMTPGVSGPILLSNCTQLNYVPDSDSLIGYSHDEYHTYCSRRRMTLLLLRNWMPSDLQFCWTCMKYTPLSGTKPTEAFFKPWNDNAKGTMVITMIDESGKEDPDSTLRVELHCHDACLPRIAKTQPMPFDLLCRHLPGGRAVHYNFGVEMQEVVYLGSEVFEWGLAMPRVNHIMKIRRVSFEEALCKHVGSPIGLWKK